MSLFISSAIEGEKGVRGINGNGYKGIALIFIENSKGEFLIQKTSKNRDSVYATTGGHVDYGDTFDHTIIKEVREELGIDISNDNIIKMGHFIWNSKKYYISGFISTFFVIISLRQ